MLVEAFLGAVGKLEGELHRGDPRDVEEERDQETGDEVQRGQHGEREHVITNVTRQVTRLEKSYHPLCDNLKQCHRSMIINQ